MSTWKPTPHARALAQHAIRQVHKQPCPADCPHPDHTDEQQPLTTNQHAH